VTFVFGGISEGVFAFFILFCTTVGMATGAYLMDKERFIFLVKEKYESVKNKFITMLKSDKRNRPFYTLVYQPRKQEPK